ncbi:hypothetical protein CRENBAI_024155, partial [Crenichthys baileyi]
TPEFNRNEWIYMLAASIVCSIDLPTVTLRFTRKNQVFCGAGVEPEFVLWNLFS